MTTSTIYQFWIKEVTVWIHEVNKSNSLKSLQGRWLGFFNIFAGVSQSRCVFSSKNQKVETSRHLNPSGGLNAWDHHLQRGLVFGFGLEVVVYSQLIMCIHHMINYQGVKKPNCTDERWSTYTLVCKILPHYNIIYTRLPALNCDYHHFLKLAAGVKQLTEWTKYRQITLSLWGVGSTGKMLACDLCDRNTWVRVFILYLNLIKLF